MIISTDATGPPSVPELDRRQKLNFRLADLACDRLAFYLRQFPRAMKAAGYSTDVLRTPEEAAAVERELSSTPLSEIGPPRARAFCKELIVPPVLARALAAAERTG